MPNSSEKILGSEVVGINVALGPCQSNRMWGVEFECSKSATKAYFIYYATNVGANFEWGIYDKSTPNALLYEGDVATNQVGWNYVEITGASFTQGTSYYLCINTESDAIAYRSLATNVKGSPVGPYPYGDGFPATYDWDGESVVSTTLAICFAVADGIPLEMVWSGDSHTQNIETDWPSKVLPGDADKVLCKKSYSIDGWTSAQVLTGYPTMAGSNILLANTDNAFLLQVGSNDLVNGRSAVDIMSDIEDIWALAKADDYYPVMAFTITASTWFDSAKEAQRIALNTLIRDASDQYDFLVDIASISELDFGDTDYSYDGMHLSALGQTLVAAELISNPYFAYGGAVTEKIICGNIGPGAGGLFANVWQNINLDTAAFNGLATKIAFYVVTGGEYKPYLYDANNNLLYSNDTPISCDSDTVVYHDLPAPISVSNGVYYKPGVMTSVASGLARYTSGSGNRQYAGPTAGFATFTAPSTFTIAGSTGEHPCVALFGYETPAITTINGGADLAHDDTGVAVVGTDFMPAEFDLEIYLCSTSDYDTAPVKVAQSVTAHDDTTATFDVAPGTLPAGTVYAFAVTELGLVSAAKSVTLESYDFDTATTRPRANNSEILRGCTIADNFFNQSIVEANGGTVVGGASVGRGDGLTVDGAIGVTYPSFFVSDFSVVVSFKATSGGLIFSTADLSGSVPSTGWCIWTDASGIYATHSDGTTVATACTVDGDFLDGETHVATYVVDLTSNEHILYVDSSSDDQSTTITGPIAHWQSISVGGITGSIDGIRLYDDVVLEESDHNAYTS